jgi:hypothetical protein
LIIVVRVIGKPSRNTLLIRTVSRAPMKLPITRPRPPRMEAPPMMTAAITISSALRPDCGEVPLSCVTAIKPAMVAHHDDSR